jgi:hypothetical protein
MTVISSGRTKVVSTVEPNKVREDPGRTLDPLGKLRS